MTLRLSDNTDDQAREVMNALAQSCFDLQAANFTPDRAAIICPHHAEREKGIHVCKFSGFTAVVCVPCMNAITISHNFKVRNNDVPRGTAG